MNQRATPTPETWSLYRPRMGTLKGNAMDQNQRDQFAKALGITPDNQSVLDSGSNHDYRCRCKVCLHWWIQMGPEDPDDIDSFGPFSLEEINDEKSRCGQK